jgi:Transposase C of IS166 homeodomain
MNSTSEALPNDVAGLRAMLVEAWAERDAERAEKMRLVAERDQLAGQNDRLRHLIRQLQRRQFGRRSERLDPDQLNLAGGGARPRSWLHQKGLLLGARPRRPAVAGRRAGRWSPPTRRGAAANTLASCKPMVMPPTANSPIPTAPADR